MLNLISQSFMQTKVLAKNKSTNKYYLIKFYDLDSSVKYNKV